MSFHQLAYVLGAMDRTYDIFEVLPGGDLMWRDYVAGHEAALLRARELSSTSTNEFRVMHLPTASTVAVFNAKESPSNATGERRDPKERGNGPTHSVLRQRNFGRVHGACRRRVNSTF